MMKWNIEIQEPIMQFNFYKTVLYIVDLGLCLGRLMVRHHMEKHNILI